MHLASNYTLSFLFICCQHACNILIKVNIVDQPRVEAVDRLHVEPLAPCVWLVNTYYGFKDHPDIANLVSQLPNMFEIPVEVNKVSYFLSRSIVVFKRDSAKLISLETDDMALWRKMVYAAMFRNSTDAASDLNLQSDLVIELGAQVEEFYVKDYSQEN